MFFYKVPPIIPIKHTFLWKQGVCLSKVYKFESTSYPTWVPEDLRPRVIISL